MTCFLERGSGGLTWGCFDCHDYRRLESSQSYRMWGFLYFFLTERIGLTAHAESKSQDVGESHRTAPMLVPGKAVIMWQGRILMNSTSNINESSLCAGTDVHF